MQISSIPSKFNIPWANSAPAANVNTIPQASQISTTIGAASLTDGFPPVTLLPVGAGGVPPWGRDMNGILKQTTQWLQWQQAGGGVLKWDSTFSAAIGGYPSNALVQGTTNFGSFWLSILDNNAADPDTTSGSGWISFGSSNLIGDARNLNGSATGTTMTAQWTVTEIIAKTGIGGVSFLGTNLTLAFNGTATAGAGAMDTGVLTAGTGGGGGVAGPGIGGTAGGIWFSVYAIFNPTTNAWNTLGTLAGSGLIYTGSAMPTGYTASTLLWTGGCGGTGGASAQINPFFQIDRTINQIPIAALTAGTQLNWTAISLVGSVPPNARSFGGILENGGGFAQLSVFPTNYRNVNNAIPQDGVGMLGSVQYNVSAGPSETTTGYFNIAIQNLQTYYRQTTGGGTVNVWSSNYTI